MDGVVLLGNDTTERLILPDLLPDVGDERVKSVRVRARDA